MRSLLAALIALLHFATSPASADNAGAAKVKVAVFPLTGSASQGLRDKIGFALRTKLNDSGNFDAIDGPTMADLAATANDPISVKTPAEALTALAKDEVAVVLIWGEVNAGTGTELHLRILDQREPDAKPHDVVKTVADPLTDMRFALEQALETIKGVDQFHHASEVSVTDDPAARALWAKNPNLLGNGDFSDSGLWTVLYQSEHYGPPLSTSLPAMDKVNIYKMPGEGVAKANNVLAMRLSEDCAANNGMACISDPFKIEPNTRYRIRFRYRSEGPTLHVFVKGYTPSVDIAGKAALRENYRRQVPPSGGTDGKWVTVVDDLNPQAISGTVKFLRVDLYAYLTPGVVMFDDVQVKAIGEMTHHAKDDALGAPVSQPTAAPKP